MITFRRKTELFDYPIFSAETIKKHINYYEVYYVCSTILKNIFKNSNNKLYGTIKSYTMEESIALCSLPLYEVNNHDNISKLELNDLNGDEFVHNISKYSVSSSEEDIKFVVRCIEIDNKYELPGPGYRIISSMDELDRNIISIINDSTAPKDIPTMVRLCGELAELVIQRFLIKNGVSVSFNSPDYLSYSDLGDISNYHSTGIIVLKDYPSISDMIFLCEYISNIVTVINFGLREIANTALTEDQIEEYFNINFNDGNKWCFEGEQLREIIRISDVENWKEEATNYIINFIKKVYFEREELC